MGYNVGTGIKKVVKDIPSIQTNPNGSYSSRLNIFANYKNLKSFLVISGNIVAKVANAVSADTELAIKYKSDHLFNYFQALELKADSDIFKNLQSNIAYFRFYQALCSLGNEYKSQIPTSITIKNGETQGVVPFKLFVRIPFLMEDMANPQQTGLLTWLYNNITLSYATTSAQNCIASVGNETLNATFEFQNVFTESVSNYQVVDNSYLNTDASGKPLNKAGVLAKIGGYFRTEEQSQIFTSAGTNQLLKLNSFGSKIFKDIFLVFRDANSGTRVEGVVDRITFTNGDSPLINGIAPEILRLDTVDRYKLLDKNFAQVDSENPDGIGELYGVYHISGDFFGDIQNSLLATGGWNQPQLYFDINQNISGLSGTTPALKIEVFTSFNEVTQSVGRLADAFATAASSVTQVS